MIDDTSLMFSTLLTAFAGFLLVAFVMEYGSIVTIDATFVFFALFIVFLAVIIANVVYRVGKDDGRNQLLTKQFDKAKKDQRERFEQSQKEIDEKFRITKLVNDIIDAREKARGEKQ